jgi:hypothetical protein
MCFWDQLPESQLLAIVVAFDVGIIFGEAHIEQMSPAQFGAPITLLPLPTIIRLFTSFQQGSMQVQMKLYSFVVVIFPSPYT